MEIYKGIFYIPDRNPYFFATTMYINTYNVYLYTPSKKKILWNFNVRSKGGTHENCCVKRPSHLRRERSTSSSFFLLVNALVYVDIDQGIHCALIGKMDEHIECAHPRWLGLFMQQFSLAPSLLRALKFHNNSFLLGVLFASNTKINVIWIFFEWRVSKARDPEWRIFFQKTLILVNEVIVQPPKHTFEIGFSFTF